MFFREKFAICDPFKKVKPFSAQSVSKFLQLVVVPLFSEGKKKLKTLFFSNSLLSLFSYYRMIVVPLTEGQDPGKSSDEKYVTVTRTYDNQEDGEPYITAEFANDKQRTEFPVGDGKYYSRDGVTEARRKRRATSELTVRCILHITLGLLLSKHFIYCCREGQRKITLFRLMQCKYSPIAMSDVILQTKGLFPYDLCDRCDR